MTAAPGGAPRPIRRLLVANRGEIARRIVRTAHRLGLATVAVYSEADARALHVREAGAAQPLGGHSAAESYLRIDAILAAARASGADAVHPGYGFLSENADFAQAVLDAGLVWVGPPPAAIRALGHKAGAKRLARMHGVPCLPGYDGEDQADARLEAEARRIGLPLMVKAAAGGGGRGMRLVQDWDALLPAIRSARSEAQASFGSGELLIERALLAPRHVEVQVVCDAHGHALHLGERDCSVQRRHQKLIEESPSPAVGAALRQRMGEAALSLARAGGYVGVGTVEFLLDGQDFYLLEMNTRLQVEHPVTEMVTGLDLVAWQLRIAQGEPLPLAQHQVQFDGHAIEVRLCAEDETFTPHTGTVRHLRAPVDGLDAAAGLRFDHAIAPGQVVTPHYDAMLGKLVAHAPTRAEALQRLAGALDRLELLGLPTNRRLLAACLRHPVFAAGDAGIAFLAQHGDALRAALQDDEQSVLVPCALAALWPEGPARTLAAPFVRPLRLRHRGRVVELPVQEQALAWQPHPAVRLPDGRWHVQHGAVDLLLQDASFDPPADAQGPAGEGALLAPFSGRVVAVHVQAGQAVRRGDTLVRLESMKLEHALAAPRDGVVHAVAVQPGQQVAAGQLLVRIGDAPP